MSKSRLAQALVLGALLAATNLVGMTGVAHATGGAAVLQDDRRPPTQGQVGESWHQRQAPAHQSAISGDARRPPTEGQVGEPWHPRGHAPTPPAQPDSQPSWPVGALAVLAAALALAGGLVANPSKPENANRARGLTTVTVTPPDGAAAPTRQPRRLAGSHGIATCGDPVGP